MSERIIIDFGDEENKPAPEESRIVIDFNDTSKKIEIDDLEEDAERKYLNSKINSCFRGNEHLNYFYESNINFPEGIDQGFRKRFSLKIDDEFFNSVLENNKYIILSSRKGSIYLISKLSGKVENKIYHDGESFEKTGLVDENVPYINSLRKIYKINIGEDNTGDEVIYDSGAEHFIWSNLNRYRNLIVFTEYSREKNSARLKILNTKNPENITEYHFEVKSFISDRICIADEQAYVVFDGKLLIFDLEKGKEEIVNLDFPTDENSFIFYLNYRIYITSVLNELYYLDLPPVSYKFKFSGIKNNYINSIGGFGDNIFIGTLDGWKFYKSSGLLVYHHEDEYENKIESISGNILAVSQKNKIVFCNLKRFQEAEGYVISTRDKIESVEIVSSVFSMREIFVLTGNGILEVFTNDKMNIFI